MPRGSRSSRRRGGTSGHSQNPPENLENEDYDATTLARFHGYFPDPIQLSRINNQEQIIGQSFVQNFDCTMTQRADTSIYDLSGNSIFTGHNVNALSGSSSQAHHFFSSSEAYGSNVFEPLVGYEEHQNFVVLGGNLGNTQDWINNLHAGNNDFWVNNTLLCASVKDMGIQVMTILTKLHQQQKFVGNLKDGLCIDRDSNKVSFTTIRQMTRTQDVGTGIEKDLYDFREFMESIKPPNIEDPNCYHLFKNLFSFIRSWNDIEELKVASFVICHSPIFWTSHERYIFIEKVYQYLKLIGQRGCDKVYNSVDPRASLHGWQLQLPQSGPLQSVYNYNGPDFYKSSWRIITFLRNCFVHYHKYDPTTSFEDLDQRLLYMFPDAYDKIYYLTLLAYNTSGMVKLLKHDIAPDVSLNYAERS